MKTSENCTGLQRQQVTSNVSLTHHKITVFGWCIIQNNDNSHIYLWLQLVNHGQPIAGASLELWWLEYRLPAPEILCRSLIVYHMARCYFSWKFMASSWAFFRNFSWRISRRLKSHFLVIFREDSRKLDDIFSLYLPWKLHFNYFNSHLMRFVMKRPTTLTSGVVWRMQIRL